MKEQYGEKIQLSYMNIDFFIFQIETEDIYKNITEYLNLFALNKDITIGKFKDKTSGNVITESYISKQNCITIY